jgi:hypothetical protein
VIDEAFWGARAASVDAIERELSRMRRAAAAHAKEQGQALGRTSVLNLVVYAEREAHARRAARTVNDLALRHPSRAIIVLADRDREGVVASVQLHCHVPRLTAPSRCCTSRSSRACAETSTSASRAS